jgi:two-component system cell cycle response regulator
LRRSSTKLSRRTVGPDSEPLRILLVEDNPRHAQLLEELMGTEGVAFAGAPPYELIHVQALAPGLEHLAGGGVDVVLLDLSLPDATGLDALMRVRERSPDVPVITLMGLNDSGLGAQAVQAGAQDYLSKGKMTASLLARSIRYAVHVIHLELALRSRSLLDGLTGVHNRRGFLALADPHFKLARRMKGRFLIVSADVTGLGEINRLAGYDEGDAVLKETAEILRRTFRDSDLVARLEASEFAVLAADAPIENSAIIAARLAHHVAVFNSMTLRRYTLAIGVGFAQFNGAEPSTVTDLLARAIDHRRGGGARRRKSRPTQARAQP